MPVLDNHSLASHCSQSETSQEREDVWPVHRVPAEQVAERETVSDSGHYAFPRKERFEIVRRYRAAREGGTVQSKHAWAEANYHISGKTLLAYEREFPETDA